MINQYYHFVFFFAHIMPVLAIGSSFRLVLMFSQHTHHPILGLSYSLAPLDVPESVGLKEPWFLLLDNVF